MFNLTKPTTYKLVLLGDTSVGKSSIASQYIQGTFSDFQEPTIGAAFMCKDTNINFNGEDRKCRFEIWDTAGQERYKSLTPMYYRGAQIAIVVYDITCQSSLQGADFWLSELRKKGPDDLLKILVGNKCDLEKERKVELSKSQQVANNHKCLHCGVSAKNSEQISKLFEKIALHALQKLPEGKPIDSEKFLVQKHKQEKSNCC